MIKSTEANDIPTEIIEENKEFLTFYMHQFYNPLSNP